MTPRFRIFALLPLLAALSFAAPARADMSWGSMSPLSVNSTCPSAQAPDPATTATDTTAAPPSGWQNSPVSVTVNGTGDHMEWMKDCGTQTQAPFGTPVSVTGDGTHTFSHRAVDASARGTQWLDETVMVDTTAPIDTTSPDPTWRNTPQTFGITGTDATSGVNHAEYNLDGGGWTTAISLTVSTDGDHAVLTHIVDNAGNVSADKTSHVRIDTAAPTDNTTFPSGWQWTPTNVTISGADGLAGVASVRWIIDGGSVQSASGNNVAVSMPEGTHTIQTQIVDAAGNASTMSAPHTVMVDTAGPTDTTSTANGWNQTGQTITVSGDDTNGSGIASVQWQLDGASTASGPNNSTVTINADGVHTLLTKVFDGHGRDSGWTTHTIRIDTLRPDDTTSVSSGWQNAPVSVDIKGSDATSGIDHVEYNLDNAGSSTNSTSNPKTITVSGDGVHSLKTRVWDQAGWSSVWTDRTIRIDTTAPSNTTPVAPGGWRTSAYAVVLNGADGGAGLLQMHYKIDGGATIDVAPGTQVSVSGNGIHTLTTWAEDAAGNSSAPRDDTVNIDNQNPNDTTTAPGAPIANNGTVAVNGNDAISGVDHVEWKIDQGDLQSGPSGSLATFVGGGAHQFQTRVVDLAGNATGWKTMTVTVDTSSDTTAPTDTSTTVGSAWRLGDVHVTVSGFDAGSGVQSVQWRLDGGSIQTGGTTAAVTITGDGTHHLETRITDYNNNTSAWRLQTISIDSTVPVDTTPISAGWTPSQTLALTATDATSGVASWEYTIDGGSTATVAAGGSVTFPGDGTHTISRRVLDVAGQASAWKTDTIKIDSTVPVLTSAAAATGWQTSAYSLALTGTDTGSGVDHAEWKVDSGSVQTGSPAVVLGDGTHTLQTRVVDGAGNVSPWRSESVKVDTTAPVNTTAQPASAWVNSSYTVPVTGSDVTSGVAAVEWKLDTGAASSSASASVTATGAHTLYSRVIDIAGNASAWRADSIGIDKTAPVLAVDCGTDAWRKSVANCAASADGGESGLDTLTATPTGGSATPVVNNVYTLSDDGDWTLGFRAVDKAGNEQTGTAHVRIDRTPPVPTVSCATGAGVTYVCHAAGTDALSGVSALSFSLNGGAPQAVAADGSFTVNKGSVVVTAADVAGNAASTAPLALADRTPAKTPTKTVARTVSEAILRSGRGTVSARVLGEIALTSLPASSTADLRPLALGKGTFRFQIKMKADKKSKSVTKTVVTKSGYSPRIDVRMGGAAHVQVDLIVRRKLGKRWTAFASGGAELG